MEAVGSATLQGPGTGLDSAEVLAGVRVLEEGQPGAEGLAELLSLEHSFLIREPDLRQRTVMATP